MVFSRGGQGQRRSDQPRRAVRRARRRVQNGEHSFRAERDKCDATR